MTEIQEPVQNEVRIETVEKLEQEVCAALDTNDMERVGFLLAEAHPADIADVIDRLDSDQREQVFGRLSREKAPKVLDELSSETTREILEDMPLEQIGSLLDAMPMDEAAEILIEDIPQRQAELLGVMSQEDAEEVRSLLQYPPESAGHMMTEKFARLSPEMTVAETLEYLRQIDPEVETLTDLYVLDPQGRLSGVVSLRSLVTSPLDEKVANLMETDLVTATPETDQEEVARLVSHYDFLALPIVSKDGRMLGIIPVDDVIDILVEETTEDILRFGGLEGGRELDQSYFTVSIPFVVRKRVGWLLLLFLAETLTGTVLRLFESELSQVVALSFFIPLLIGTGGNTGAQTVSTLIRGLALGEVQWRDIWRVVGRELLSGLLLGSLLGFIGFGRTLLWGNGAEIATVVALSTLSIVTWANTIGSVVPMIAYKLKVDPAIVSAPLITTLVDATGLAIYFFIAKQILGL